MAARKDGKGRALRKGECQRSDGRYVYTYTDPFGKRRYIYSKNLLKLREKEEKLIRDQMDGLNVYVAGTATINMVFDRYLSTKCELKSTTRSNYIWTWNYFIRDTFGKKKIGDVKYSDVLQFYTYLIKDRGIEVNSLENVNTVLHPTFKLAVRDDIIRKNPADGAFAEVKKRFGGRRKLRRAMSVEQQKAFIRYIEESPFFDSWYPLFTTLLGTGCRVGEVIGLRWDDVDLEKRTININHNLTYYPRREDTYTCEFRISTPKTEAGIRTIPMMGPVYDVLSGEYERQLEEGFCTKSIDGMTNFIFTNRFGNPHNPQAINRAINRILAAYNSEEEVKAVREKRDPVMIPHISCHIFRHTFASRLCEKETNIKVIQQIMGHADVATTMNIYAEVNEATTRQSIESLELSYDELF